MAQKQQACCGRCSGHEGHLTRNLEWGQVTVELFPKTLMSTLNVDRS